MIVHFSNGESIYTIESANELRKKMVSVQREIITLAERLADWGLNPEDPLVSHPPDTRELILQKNIKQMAIGSLATVLMDMPELPTEEQYAELRTAYQERLVARRRELERDQAESNSRVQVLRVSSWVWAGCGICSSLIVGLFSCSHQIVHRMSTLTLRRG